MGKQFITDELLIGGSTSANALDDYEEGTFTLNWVQALYGGLSYYTLADFGGATKSDNSKYVKVGRHVTITSHFAYETLPSFNQYGEIFVGNLPFAMTQSSYGSGSYYCFPGLTQSSFSYRLGLHARHYGTGVHISFDSGRYNYLGDIAPMKVTEMPSHAYSTTKNFYIKFSYYTNS